MGSEPSPTRRHVFASAAQTSSSGSVTRVYKQIFNLTPEELRDFLGGHQADEGARADRQLIESCLKDESGDAGALLVGRLSEETLRRAWPGTSRSERRRIALSALIQLRRSEEALREISERCRAEGLDVEELMSGYLRAAEAPPVFDPQEASEIAASATEYFKVAGELGGLDLRKICLELLAEARTRAIDELAEKESVAREEAVAFFTGTLTELADEFQGVLEVCRRDAFGWTLDEHLQFTIERRETQR